MSNFSNSKKDKFLQSIPQVSLDSKDNNLTLRAKFNFSYIDESQGQKFSDWSHEQLVKLLNKLKEYSRESLKHWQNAKIGTGQHRFNVLSIYSSFPKDSNFTFPKHVPHQVCWARFRLEWDARLIGFIIPPDYHNKPHHFTHEFYDCNTFYVVFLDIKHDFYK